MWRVWRSAPNPLTVGRERVSRLVPQFLKRPPDVPDEEPERDLAGWYAVGADHLRFPSFQFSRLQFGQTLGGIPLRGVHSWSHWLQVQTVIFFRVTMYEI